MADDELDELHRVKPENFTAVRTRLAADAKKRGDSAAAKRISATRKPTTAAWIVNRLVLGDEAVKRRLTDLGERLRDAHAAMDGDQIRGLSSERHSLVDELSRAAFGAAEVTHPSAALREDVSATLEAAIADPDVSARLGRLTKAERWSGFGVFGETAPVFTGEARSKAKPDKHATEKPREDAREATRQREKARAAVAAAEREKTRADDELSERQADLAAARLRHDDARRRFDEAERTLKAAEGAYAKAKRASRDAGELVKEAKSLLKKSGSR